jgi:hypothetical protein
VDTASPGVAVTAFLSVIGIPKLAAEFGDGCHYCLSFATYGYVHFVPHFYVISYTHLHLLVSEPALAIYRVRPFEHCV